jgi:hypothetical protein
VVAGLGVTTTQFVITGGDGRAVAVALLAVGHEGAPSTAVLVPGSLALQAPGLDRQLVADLTVVGTEGTMRLALENLLGLRIDGEVALAATATQAALAKAAPLTISLRNPVNLTDGTEVHAYPSGTQSVGAADAWRLLAIAPAGGERDHLDIVQAVLAGWAAKADHLAPGVVPAPVAGIATRGMTFDTVPVQPSGIGAVENFTLDDQAAAAVLPKWFPGSRPTFNGIRPRVEILNGSGAVGVTQAAAFAVVPLGFNVTLTGNSAGFGVPHSAVFYYKAAYASAAHRVAAALHITTVRRVQSNVNVVELNILLGSDFRAP